MAKRIWAATFIVILAGGVTLAPDVSARGRGPSHAPAPQALHAPVGKTVAHASAHLGFRHARLNHRRDGGLWNGWWNTGWYGGYTDSSGYGPTANGPAAAETAPSYPSFYTGGPYPAPYAAPPAQKPLDVIVYRPGCHSVTKTIPWSDGKDRTITMVRC